MPDTPDIRTTLEILERHRAEDANRAELVARLTAEVIVLEQYDRERRRAGHDYGNGQRARELTRYRRELRRNGAEEWPEDHAATPAELVEAARRLIPPRLARIDAESYRKGTPATMRTMRVLDEVLDDFEREAEAAGAESDR